MEDLDKLTNKELIDLLRLVKEHLEFLENEEKKLKEVEKQWLKNLKKNMMG